MGNKKISWLHISDLHVGQGNHWLWPEMRQIFFEDLTALAKEVGPWQFVIFSGDVVQSGKKSEYLKATEELQLLWAHFESLGQNPKLLVVPGNHDLVRPETNSQLAVSSRHWHAPEEESVRRLFWSNKKSWPRKALNKAFLNYTNWLEGLSLPKPEIRHGLLPGDYSTTINVDDLKIGIVGLNTTYLQVTSSDYEKKLDLHIQQLNDVCQANPPGWGNKHDISLLITHQPPEWLHPLAQEQLQSIYASARFNFHFCGHLHKAHAKTLSQNGGREQRLRQASSLFGLEKYGIQQTERTFGYTAGQWTLNGDQAVEKLWPRLAYKSGETTYKMGADNSFNLVGTNAFVEMPFRISAKTIHPVAVVPDPILTTSLKSVIEQAPALLGPTVVQPQLNDSRRHVSNNAPVRFTEQTIYELFGNEAAEGEALKRLKEFYFKGPTFNKICSPVPLRLLVGHKGIGKSALFKVAMAEDIEERGFLTVLIKPDDVAEIQASDENILNQIRTWKVGIINVISRKILESFSIPDAKEILSKVTWYTGQVIETLEKCLINASSNGLFNEKQQAIVQKFLETKTIVIYVDDLDRGWQGRPQDIQRISALLNTVRDLSAENEGVRFRIALRSDVFFLYRTADESTDKVEGAVIWYSWTNHDILTLLAKRIETYFGRELDESRVAGLPQSRIAEYLNPVMAGTFHGRGEWQEIPTFRMLMTLIRRRPRDLVKICTLAARKAHDMGASKINSQHFSEVFEEYSQGRIQDTVNEYRSELRDIERLLFSMRPTTKEKNEGSPFLFTTEKLLKKIKNITQSGQFRFSNGNIASERELAAFLYKINFLTARKDLNTGEIDRKYFEESRYLSNRFVDFGYSWEVHPAYRFAMQTDSLDEILAKLDSKFG